VFDFQDNDYNERSGSDKIPFREMVYAMNPHSNQKILSQEALAKSCKNTVGSAEDNK